MVRILQPTYPYVLGDSSWMCRICMEMLSSMSHHLAPGIGNLRAEGFLVCFVTLFILIGELIQDLSPFHLSVLEGFIHTGHLFIWGPLVVLIRINPVTISVQGFWLQGKAVTDAGGWHPCCVPLGSVAQLITVEIHTWSPLACTGQMLRKYTLSLHSWHWLTAEEAASLNG